MNATELLQNMARDPEMADALAETEVPSQNYTYSDAIAKVLLQDIRDGGNLSETTFEQRYTNLPANLRGMAEEYAEFFAQDILEALGIFGSDFVPTLDFQAYLNEQVESIDEEIRMLLHVPETAEQMRRVRANLAELINTLYPA